MARVTVEDCIDKVDSPYELVLVAKERATQLNSGIEPTLDRDNDKNTVISLREIAEETITVEDIKESMIVSMQTHIIDDEVATKDDDDLEGLEPTDKDSINDTENNMGKFGMQIQDRYEDI